MRTAITAAERQGGLVLLVGSSSVGKTRALFEAVNVQRRFDQAISVLRQCADVGDMNATDRLAGLLAAQGRIDELRRRADAGDGYAADRLAGLLVERGCLDEAVTVLRPSVDAGDTNAISRLADLLAERGCVDEAISVLRQRAEAGDGYAAHRLADLLVTQGRADELQAEVHAGTYGASDRLVMLARGEPAITREDPVRDQRT